MPEFFDPTGNPKLSEVKHKLLEERNNEELLYPAGLPEPNNNIPSNMNEIKDTNNDRRETDDYLNELNSTLNELSEDVLMYENNSDYLSALDDVYCNVEDIHIGNDYSQLV